MTPAEQAILAFLVNELRAELSDYVYVASRADRRQQLEELLDRLDAERRAILEDQDVS